MQSAALGLQPLAGLQAASAGVLLADGTAACTLLADAYRRNGRARAPCERAARAPEVVKKEGRAAPLRFFAVPAQMRKVRVHCNVARQEGSFQCVPRGVGCVPLHRLSTSMPEATRQAHWDLGSFEHAMARAVGSQPIDRCDQVFASHPLTVCVGHFLCDEAMTVRRMGPNARAQYRARIPNP